MILLSCQNVEEHKEEINKINVFPVPDQDTGNNLSATLKGIKEVVENKEFNNLEEFSAAALDGALTAAQSNAGIIYTGFLAGFLPLLNKNPASAEKLAVLRQAILTLKPRYQTIIALRFFENLKLTEIAEVLGSSPGTVRSQLSRALAKLKKKINMSHETI